MRSAIPYCRIVPAPTNEPTFCEMPCASIALSQASKPCGVREASRHLVGVGTKRRRIERRRRRAFAEDAGRHTLRELAELASVAGEQLPARLILNVDEARGDDEVARVDARLRRRRAEHAARRHGDDAIAANADVAVEPRGARSVDDASVLDDDVVG